MLIRFINEETSWIYKNEAVVALVGKEAMRQFQNVSLFVNEMKSAYPFVCFDTPTKEDFDYLVYDQEIDNKLKFGMKERLSLCNTDMLFVLSELETAEEVKTCLLYVEQAKEDGISFFITHEKNKHREELVSISDKFKHIIYIENEVDNLFYPVKQLLCDYYRPGFIGIDMADVWSVYSSQQRKNASFLRHSFTDMKAMREYASKLLQCLKFKKASADSCQDFLVFMEISPKVGLDDIEEILMSLAGDYIDSQIIWSCNFNNDESDETCTLTVQTVYNN